MRQSRMVTIGVTGGVGSGKSFVLSHLENQYKAFVVRADEVGHEVMAPGGGCYEPVLKLFGQECLLEDKSLDRKKIAQVIFSDEEKRQALDALIHPAVEKRILSLKEEWEREEEGEKEEKIEKKQEGNEKIKEEGQEEKIEKDKKKECPRLFVIEAALLLEAGYDRICDTLWYVYAPKEEREKWLLESRGYSPEKTRSIMDRQGDEEEFRKRCDVVLENISTPQALLLQVDEQVAKLLEEK